MQDSAPHRGSFADFKRGSDDTSGRPTPQAADAKSYVSKASRASRTSRGSRRSRRSTSSRGSTSSNRTASIMGVKVPERSLVKFKLVSRDCDDPLLEVDPEASGFILEPMIDTEEQYNWILDNMQGSELEEILPYELRSDDFNSQTTRRTIKDVKQRSTKALSLGETALQANVRDFGVELASAADIESVQQSLAEINEDLVNAPDFLAFLQDSDEEDWGDIPEDELKYLQKAGLLRMNKRAMQKAAKKAAKSTSAKQLSFADESKAKMKQGVSIRPPSSQECSLLNDEKHEEEEEKYPDLDGIWGNPDSDDDYDSNGQPRGLFETIHTLDDEEARMMDEDGIFFVDDEQGLMEDEDSVIQEVELVSSRVLCADPSSSESKTMKKASDHQSSELQDDFVFEAMMGMTRREFNYMKNESEREIAALSKDASNERSMKLAAELSKKTPYLTAAALKALRNQTEQQGGIADGSDGGIVESKYDRTLSQLYQSLQSIQEEEDGEDGASDVALRSDLAEEDELRSLQSNEHSDDDDDESQESGHRLFNMREDLDPEARAPFEYDPSMDVLNNEFERLLIEEYCDEAIGELDGPDSDDSDFERRQAGLLDGNGDTQPQFRYQPDIRGDADVTEMLGLSSYLRRGNSNNNIRRGINDTGVTAQKFVEWEKYLKKRRKKDDKELDQLAKTVTREMIDRIGDDDFNIRAVKKIRREMRKEKEHSRLMKKEGDDYIDVGSDDNNDEDEESGFHKNTSIRASAAVIGFDMEDSLSEDGSEIEIELEMDNDDVTASPLTEDGIDREEQPSEEEEILGGVDPNYPSLYDSEEDELINRALDAEFKPAPRDRWDVESILSTRTNHENHPFELIVRPPDKDSLDMIRFKSGVLDGIPEEFVKLNESKNRDEKFMKERIRSVIEEQARVANEDEMYGDWNFGALDSGVTDESTGVVTMTMNDDLLITADDQGIADDDCGAHDMTGFEHGSIEESDRRKESSQRRNKSESTAEKRARKARIKQAKQQRRVAKKQTRKVFKEMEQRQRRIIMGAKGSHSSAYRLA